MCRRSTWTLSGLRFQNFVMTSGQIITSIVLTFTLTTCCARHCNTTYHRLSHLNTSRPMSIPTRKLCFVSLITPTVQSVRYCLVHSRSSDSWWKTISDTFSTKTVLTERIGNQMVYRSRSFTYIGFCYSASALLNYSNLSIANKIPIEYIIIEVMFGEFFNLPRNRHPEICYGSIFLDLCKLQPSTFPQAVRTCFT